MKKLWIFVLIIGAALVFAGVGCGKKNKAATGGEEEVVSEDANVEIIDESAADEKGNVMVETEAPEEEEALTMPEKDAEGNDVADIGRVPNSIRTEWDKADEFEEATYRVKDTAQKVNDYYIENVPKNGWKHESSEDDILGFKKNKALVNITILDERNGITEYQVTLWPKYGEE